MMTKTAYYMQMAQEAAEMCIRDRVYTAPLLPYKDQNTMLEELYAKFNVSRPDDFTGHSLSVSDICLLYTSHHRKTGAERLYRAQRR